MKQSALNLLGRQCNFSDVTKPRVQDARDVSVLRIVMERRFDRGDLNKPTQVLRAGTTVSESHDGAAVLWPFELFLLALADSTSVLDKSTENTSYVELLQYLEQVICTKLSGTAVYTHPRTHLHSALYEVLYCTITIILYRTVEPPD